MVSAKYIVRLASQEIRGTTKSMGKRETETVNVEFELEVHDDELTRITDDADYDGPAVVWATTDVRGTFLKVPVEELVTLTRWLVGTNGIEFKSLTAGGVDLLSEIEAERKNPLNV